MASSSIAVAYAVITVLSVGQPRPAAAQNSAPQLRQGGYFANMFRFEFRPGKSDEGLTILRETLIPAYRKAGIDVLLIEDMVGTKDLYLGKAGKVWDNDGGTVTLKDANAFTIETLVYP